jgi:hypothetical protein
MALRQTCFQRMMVLGACFAAFTALHPGIHFFAPLRRHLIVIFQPHQKAFSDLGALRGRGIAKALGRTLVMPMASLLME